MSSDADQLDLDFHAPVADGYAHWLWDQQQAVQRISEVWGLPINRRVRLKLINIDQDFEGPLRLAQLPPDLNRNHPLSLCLAPMTFSNKEIERCTVLD